MLNRRHLRIKILQGLYAYCQSNNENYAAGEKELLHSIDKMYDLYLEYLLILPELRNFADRKLEERKRKIMPSAQDLDPVRNFVDNSFILKFENSSELHHKAEDNSINWVGDIKQDLIKKLFGQIEQCDTYRKFMSLERPSYEEERSFAVELFKKEIANSNILLNHFEEVRIHWQDDFDHVFSMIVKLFKSIKKEDDAAIMDLYKDDEEEFVVKLFRKAVAQMDENSQLLSTKTKNWDSDRLAKMDILLMNLALTEAKEFPSIPLRVTMNEFIEISKYYSTPKSSNFINGVLDKLFSELKESGKIKKIGRGLV